MNIWRVPVPRPKYCARKLGWERIVCTKEENGQRVMRSADEIHAEVMDRLAGLV